MPEKHINRLTKSEEDTKNHFNQNVTAEDEWAHITETGPKLEIVDPLAVTARQISFGKERSYSTKEEAVQDKSERFKDDISNTNQYLKFVNAHLAAKKDKINKLKADEQRFKEELESLQNFQVKPRADLDKIHYKKITENDTNSLLMHLQSEREAALEKIAYHQTQIERSKQELREKDAQIADVKKEIEILNKKKETQQDPIDVIRAELARLGITDDAAKILGAVNSLENIVKKKA
jgi:DNA repair exonuclease SbcCD ATPase subunit